MYDYLYSDQTEPFARYSCGEYTAVFHYPLEAFRGFTHGELAGVSVNWCGTNKGKVSRKCVSGVKAFSTKWRQPRLTYKMATTQSSNTKMHSAGS